MSSGGSNHVAATAPHANPNFARAGGGASAGRVMLSPTESLGATNHDSSAPHTSRALTLTPLVSANADASADDQRFMDTKDFKVINAIIDDLNRFDADGEEIEPLTPSDKLPEEQVSFLINQLLLFLLMIKLLFCVLCEPIFYGNGTIVCTWHN